MSIFLHNYHRFFWRCYSGATQSITRNFSVAAASNILSSPLTDVSIPNETLSQLFLERMSRHPASLGMINGVSGEKFTNEALLSKSLKLATWLHKNGFREGDVIGIAAPNLPEYAITLLATWHLNGVAALYNPLTTADDMQHFVKISRPKIIFSVTLLMNTVKKACHIAEQPITKYVSMDGEHSDHSLPLAQILDSTPAEPLPALSQIDTKSTVACIPFSSGTTGFFKGVSLSHHNIISNICQLSHPRALLSSSDDTFLCFLPFFHIYGNVVILLCGLYNHTNVVSLPRFDLEHYLQAIQTYRPTHAHIVPPVALLLSKNPLVRHYDLSSIQSFICGAAPLSAQLAQECLEKTRVKCFREGYGMTELSPVSHFNPKDKIKFGSVGVLLSNQQCKISDLTTGEALGPNEDGEVCVKGPNVMLGYTENPEATTETIDHDGFLKTGDIGRYDDDGYFYMVDRKKELIKYKGFQVAPAELEHLLLSHPAVQDAAVIGIPDDEAGELPRAYIALRTGKKLSEGEIQAFVNQKVPPYKQIKGGIEFTNQIPKSATGKILRKDLVKAYKQSFAESTASS